jgi:dipeptidyl aminopeptidase/acylaminoacyl peptidase
MKRSRRRLAPSGLAALVLLAGCTSPARTNLAPPRPRAASTGSAAPSTGPASTRPGRVRLHGRVAFASDRGGNVDLYQLELPSGRLRRLTTSPAADLSPTWSPDGRRLAFRSDRDGSAVTRLTRAGSEEQEPAFVPCEGACA